MRRKRRERESAVVVVTLIALAYRSISFVAVKMGTLSRRSCCVCFTICLHTLDRPLFTRYATSNNILARVKASLERFRASQCFNVEGFSIGLINLGKHFNCLLAGFQNVQQYVKIHFFFFKSSQIENFFFYT